MGKIQKTFLSLQIILDKLCCLFVDDNPIHVCDSDFISSWRVQTHGGTTMAHSVECALAHEIFIHSLSHVYQDDLLWST